MHWWKVSISSRSKVWAHVRGAYVQWTLTYLSVLMGTCHSMCEEFSCACGKVFSHSFLLLLSGERVDSHARFEGYGVGSLPPPAAFLSKMELFFSSYNQNMGYFSCISESRAFKNRKLSITHALGAREIDYVSEGLRSKPTIREPVRLFVSKIRQVFVTRQLTQTQVFVRVAIFVHIGPSHFAHTRGLQ